MGRSFMESMTPRFSICIPTIGRFDLIKTALESLQKQTLQDFEVIIGDSHRNPDIVQYVAGLQDSRIRVVHPPPDAGAFAPWDYPPRFARGEYLMWLDDDNYLLPFALELFSNTITRTGADIITASHLYYYDPAHPKPELRRSIGIVPFTGKEYAIDLDKTLRQIFSFARPQRGEVAPRFHFSATIVSRKVIEKAYQKLGHVLFPDLPHMHSLTPVLFSFAKNCTFVDLPVSVIGRLGVSMGQSWSTSARKRFERKEKKAGLSPLTAYTKINTRYESYLRVRQELPDYFKDILIDEEKFAEIHLQELLLLDMPLATTFRSWREFFSFLKRIKEPTRSRLKRKTVLYAVLSPLIYCSRRVRLHYVRRSIVGLFKGTEQSPKQAVHSWTREFSIPLPREAVYDSIVGVGENARELIHSMTGHELALPQTTA